jgi:hypothetical protein
VSLYHIILIILTAKDTIMLNAFQVGLALLLIAVHSGFYASATDTGHNTTLLSGEPHISVHYNFLSHEECEKIINYTKLTKKYITDREKDHLSIYLDEYPRLPDFLKGIEKRIAAITGQAPHPDEESINIHRISAVSEVEHDESKVKECLKEAGKTAQDCKMAVSGVHHDKVQKEDSSSTVIIYLNDVQLGGGTVFPCTYNSKASKGGHCNAAFKTGGRWYDGDKAVVKGIYQKHKPTNKVMTESLDEILLGAHNGCLPDANVSSTSVVRSVPMTGTAVHFYHNRPDLTPEVQAWHAGCLPMSGYKWTLQKFKETPVKYRKTETKTKTGEL